MSAVTGDLSSHGLNTTATTPNLNQVEDTVNQISDQVFSHESPMVPDFDGDKVTHLENLILDNARDPMKVFMAVRDYLRLRSD